ncbi:hypothetical protein Wildcat_5 [Mycobacterium phage Wildcat]|uniref:Uncharacterized protein n=3 Tax=Mycobacterium virus Wildcat TaxID=1993859 RepID=Q19Y55_9CAUD|nr:hypothetical protein Wildcat_5 [Mycobacterium phage Wildcat]ABE67610.1 hypothetical protein Wildcat_5 [Mycobacterium phage Wildcat]AJD82077.1 hypothetical protein COSMO_5 [Mycobacterium phage Cosmo]QGJ90029.1 hypothetical protein PBI_MARYV_5 [Mycobacterium phage MaryV]WKR36018.1 hypothetical protein [Mycobacterium phage Azrael100]
MTYNPVLHQMRIIHSRSFSVPFTCRECGKPWPCRTVELIREARVLWDQATMREVPDAVTNKDGKLA